MKPLVGTSSSSYTPPEVSQGVELISIPDTRIKTESHDTSIKPKVPSKDSPIRWFSFFLFLAVALLLIVVLTIMIAIDKHPWQNRQYELLLL